MGHGFEFQNIIGGKFNVIKTKTHSIENSWKISVSFHNVLILKCIYSHFTLSAVLV